MDETWEGPFKVMEVDEEVGGYKLREAGGQEGGRWVGSYQALEVG